MSWRRRSDGVGPVDLVERRHRGSMGRRASTGSRVKRKSRTRPDPQRMIDMRMLALLLASLLCLRSEVQAQVTLTNVTVVDVRSGRTQPGMTVLIDSGRIASIAANRVAPVRGRQIDGTGKFLIPGLWDMHVHLIFGDWFPGAREITLPLFVANGVTGVRDMGSDLDPVLAWRKAVAARSLLGPRIVTPGPMLDR